MVRGGDVFEDGLGEGGSGFDALHPNRCWGKRSHRQCHEPLARPQRSPVRKGVANTLGPP